MVQAEDIESGDLGSHLAFPLTSIVTLGESHNVTELQFPLL